MGAQLSLARWPGRALAAVAGMVPALAFPEPSLWLFGIVGLVPLLYLVCTAPSGREAAWRGWFGGIGYFVAVHHWLIPATGPFIVPLTMALAVLWIPWAWLAWELLGRRLSVGSFLAALVVVPAAWVAAEYVRAWDRLGGPWGLLGATQWTNPGLLPLASLGGIWLLGFLLVAVNVAVTSVALPAPAARTRPLAAVSAALLLTIGFASTLAQQHPEPAGSFDVAGVQSGVIHDPIERLAVHEELTRELMGADVDLVVWAESSVGVALEPGSRRMLRIVELSRDLGAPILLNVDSRVGAGGISKASVVVGPEGIEARYDKMRLVPFGEYVPLRPLFGWVTAFTDAADEDRRRGAGLVVMDTDGAAIGPLVCFESAFPDLGRELARRGADVIVLQTATTTFQGSWAQAQHASLAAIRAVETGRPVVHATLSGVSAAFGADGTRLMSMDNTETGTWRTTLELTTGTTVYVRTGDWVPMLSVAVLAIAVVAILVTRRNAPVQAGEHRSAPLRIRSSRP